MTVAQSVAAILAFSVVLGWVRLLLWQRRAPASSRTRGWRLAALLALQPIAGLLLFSTLFPPASAGKATGTLVIATAGAPRFVTTGAGERLIALPEASGVVGAEHLPDLGTAVRRYPDAGALRIVGSGLEPRDQEANAGLAVRFEPARAPSGLIALQPPGPIAAGARFAVTARAGDLADGSAELLDPRRGSSIRNRSGRPARLRCPAPSAPRERRCSPCVCATDRVRGSSRQRCRSGSRPRHPLAW